MRKGRPTTNNLRGIKIVMMHYDAGPDYRVVASVCRALLVVAILSAAGLKTRRILEDILVVRTRFSDIGCFYCVI